MNWREALQAHLDAIHVCGLIAKNGEMAPGKTMASGIGLQESWNREYQFLQDAVPFAWTKDTTTACMHASKSIPMDSLINMEILDEIPSQFWYFEEGLNIFPILGEGFPIKAMSITRCVTPSGLLGYAVSTYVDNPNLRTQTHLSPSQSVTWPHNVDLNAVCDYVGRVHDRTYAKDGLYYGGDEHQRLISREKFVGCSADTLRFVIAAAVWLKQKVVHMTEDQGDRSRRREFQRITKREPSHIKIVHLRRLLATEKPQPLDLNAIEDSHKREFSCQWVVEGHWRNQPCGVGRESRRLQFIMPYVKGPEDKPLRTHEKKIVVVDR